MIIKNPSGGNGAGGNGFTHKTALKRGRTFFFSNWNEVDRFCKQHSISHDDIETKGTVYSYTHK